MSGHVPQRVRRSALSSQLGVLHALLVREMQQRFGRSRIGYVWLLAEPLLLGFGIAVLHWMTESHLPNNIPVFLFYALGYMPFYMFRSILTRNAGAIPQSMQLLFHRNIKLHDRTMSRTMLEVVACMAVVALLVGGGIVFLGEWPAYPGLFVLSLLLSALLGHGFGTLLASLITFYEPLERVIHPLTDLMMPFSGAFVMLSSVTPSAREALLWVPLVHVHEAMRYAQWGDRIVAYYNIPYTLLWVLVLNVLAIASLRVARRHLTMSG